MTALAERIADEALQLPCDERAALVEVLLRSLNSPIAAEIDSLWADEAERRVREIAEGKLQPLDGETVFRELREKLAR